MSSQRYRGWSSVKDTTEDRLNKKSSIGTVFCKRKIRKLTKLVNNKIKTDTFNQTYNNFIHYKTEISEQLINNEDVTDESDIDNKDYETFYNTLNISNATNLNNSVRSENDGINTKNSNTEDWFLWLYIEKKGRKIESKTTDDKQFNHKSSKLSNKNLNIIEKTNTINVEHDIKENNKLEKINFKSKRKVNKKRQLKNKNNFESAINSPNSKTCESSDNDWNDELISSDFQIDNNRILCSTFTDVNNKKNKKFKNKLNLSKIESINQPRDSGIEEDSKEDNTKPETITNNQSVYKSTIKENKHGLTNYNENSQKNSNLENKIQGNVSGKLQCIKTINNLSEIQEKNNIEAHNKKVQLKIIGEEKVMKKYKIIHSLDKESSQEEHNSKSQLDKANKDNNFEYKISKCINENSIDYSNTLINTKNNKSSKIEENELNDNSEEIDLSNNQHFSDEQNSVNTSTNSKNKNYTNKDNKKTKRNKEKCKNESHNKLKNSTSLHLSRKYKKLKHLNLLDSTEDDSDHKSNSFTLEHDTENSTQDDEVDFNNKFSDLKKDLKILSNENLNDDTNLSIKTKYKDEKNKKQTSILIDKEQSVFNSDESLKNSIFNLSKYQQIDVNNDKNVNSKKKYHCEIEEKNTTILNVQKNLHDDKNDIDITPDSDSYKTTEENERSMDIDILDNCDSLSEIKTEYDRTKISKNFKDMNTNKKEDSIDDDKYFTQIDKINSFDKNEENIVSLETKKNLSHNKDKFINVKSKKRRRNSSSNSSYISSENFDINTEKKNSLILDCLSENKNIDKKKTNNNDLCETLKLCESDNKKTNNNNTFKISKHCIYDNNIEIDKVFLSENKLLYSSDDEKDDNNDIQIVNDNSKMITEDQEIDINILSSEATKRLKLLKRLNLYEDSEESDEERDVKSIKQTNEEDIEIKQLQNNSEKDAKLTDNQYSDDQIQEMNINTSSSDINIRSKLLRNFNPLKQDAQKSYEGYVAKCSKDINTMNNQKSDDDESDPAMLALTLKKVSQFKKMNLLNSNSSSSEDESSEDGKFIEKNKNIINKLMQKDEISQKQTSLNSEINQMENFNESNIDEKSKISDSSDDEKFTVKNNNSIDNFMQKNKIPQKQLNSSIQSTYIDEFNINNESKINYSSDDEQFIVTNKNVIDILTQNNNISQKKINLNKKKTDVVNFNESIVDNEKINLCTNKLLNIESPVKENKIVKSKSFKIPEVEEFNLVKNTDTEINDNKKKIKNLNEDNKNKMIISDTQESIGTQQEIFKSEELKNLNKVDKNKIIINETQENICTQEILESEELENLNKNDKNNTIIKETQEDRSTQEILECEGIKNFNTNNKNEITIKETQEILESEDIFSSLDNLTENLNLNTLIANEKLELTSNNLKITNKITPSPTIKKITKISELVKKENLSKCSYESTVAFDEISADEEVFLLDVPKDVFSKNLIGEKISFAKSTLQIGNIKYEAFQRRAIPTISCVFKLKKNVKVPFKILNIRPVKSIATKRKKSIPNFNEGADIEKKTENEESEMSFNSVKNECVNEKLLKNITKNNMEQSKEVELNKKEVKNEKKLSDPLVKAKKEKKLSDSLVKVKKENKISKNVIPIEEERDFKNQTVKKEKILKRKLRAEFRDKEEKDEESKNISLGNFSNKSSPEFKKLKTLIKKNVDLNEDKYKVENESKFENKILEWNKVKSKVKKEDKIKRLRSSVSQDDKNVVHEQSNQLSYSSGNACKSTNKAIKKTKDECSNTDVKIEKKPKVKRSIKKKTKKELNSAISEILNLIKKSIKFNPENNLDYNDENCRYNATDEKCSVIKKCKSPVYSSSDEDEPTNRSFQIINRAQLKSSENPDLLNFKKSQSGLFVVKDVKCDKKIYFDE